MTLPGVCKGFCLMQRMKGGRALVGALKSLGVDTVFGIPGVHTLEIYDALYDATEIRHIVCRHEQGAAMMADGYARASGRPGVTTLITGPGLLNAATGLGQAYSDSAPVFAICAQNPRPDYGGGRGLLHETKDQLGAAASIVGWAKRAESASEIPDLVYEAWDYMQAGRRRPAYLELPLDVLAQETGSAHSGAPSPRTGRRPDAALLSQAARLLSGARRPAIIAGAGAAGAAADLRRLAEKIAAACLTSVCGKGTFDERAPLALGARGVTREVMDWISRCDVVLAIGTEMAPVDFNLSGPLQGKVIRVDADPEEMAHNISPDLPILGDAAEAARFLAENVEYASAEERAERTAAIRALMATARAGEAGSHVTYGAIQAALRAALPDEAIVVNDMTGLCYRMATTDFPMTAPGRFLFPQGYGTLGWSVPAALGAKLALPGAPVVAVVGDGGLLYTVQELATAVKYKVPLPIILLNNECYDEIRLSMEEFSPGRVMACDVVNPDFMELAGAFKMRGARLTEPGRQLGDAIAAALQADGPTLIEIPVAPAAPR